MNGGETLRALRQMPGVKQKPVLFMTARVHEKDRKEMLSLGAQGIIPKPFDPMELPRILDQILRAHPQNLD